MNELATVKLEIDIAANKIMQQSKFYSQELDKAIEAGITKALKQVYETPNFEDVIAELVKTEISNQVKLAVQDWSIRCKLKDAIGAAIDGKIDELATNWANKMAGNVETLINDKKESDG